jgi:phospholipid/cholesterol/gamma-HCH transport system permease protein
MDSSLAKLLLLPVESLGAMTLAALRHVGAATWLAIDTLAWLGRGIALRRVRLGVGGIVAQIVRIGVRSVFIVSLVSACVGLILAFQLAPPLEEFGQKENVARIIGVAILRELGPLIGAIVLTGFAGASIAAEIGTMVVSEEIEALESLALDPIRFLVVPRVVASIISMTLLAVIADIVAIVSALGISMLVLDIPKATFLTNLFDQVKMVDFVTGVAKGTVFGALIGIIACVNGLSVQGGAAGVGRATTYTVVQSVLAIVIADLAFTAVFYALKLV